jgi:uncharacterized membrane protein YdjX (TVP38/TMEM64 family)
MWRLAVLPVVLAAVFAAWPLLHLHERAVALREWIATLGPLAPVVYAAADVVAVPLVVPALAFTVGAAALFGPALGLLVVVVGSNLGSALCFLIARYLAREQVEQLVGRNERLRHLDELVTEHGALSVAFVRLIPVLPFELVSYAFGLTGVDFGTYVLWTAIGSLPGAALFVLAPSIVIQALTTGHFPTGLAIVFVAVLVLVIVLARAAARRLEQGSSRRRAQAPSRPREDSPLGDGRCGMDRGSMGGRVQDWMWREFGAEEAVSRGELVSRARGSGLPEEAMRALDGLPDETLDRDRWLHEVVDVLESRAGCNELGLGIGPGSDADR